MQLLNVVTARSIWLFDIAELNPRGKALFPDLFDWLKDVYNFQKVPTSLEDVDATKALVFANGQYQAREEVFVHVELKMYNDGLIANTVSSTRETDRFLDAVLVSAAAEFNLNFKPEMVRKKIYLSEMNVYSPKYLSDPRLEKFASKISEFASDNGPVEFDFAGVAFWPLRSRDVTIGAFHIERKANTNREEHKYFSRAPLHTDDHLGLLTQFEDELMVLPSHD